jgi:septal ring factor EnvC (AmiA/AmiB activator)
MTTPRAVESTPVTRNGHDDDEPSGRSIAEMLVRLEAKADASITDLRAIRAMLATIADEQTRQAGALRALERDRNADDERHGQIVAALARIESRESVHRTQLDSITEEVTEVKAAHGGWLAVGSFMNRHKKVAQTVAVLVLFAMQLFQMLKK